MKDAHRKAAAVASSAVGARSHSGLVINIVHAPGPSQGLLEVEAAIRRDPCAVLGHRAAWLVRGGMACGVCGCPL